MLLVVTHARSFTNRYELTFRRQSATRWVSNAGPNGLCGVIEITTLEEDPQGSGLLWTMNSRKVLTNKNANDFCRALDNEPPDDLTWRDTKRPLPCKFVVPAVSQ
jgi:hypothetical protein